MRSLLFTAAIVISLIYFVVAFLKVYEVMTPWLSKLNVEKELTALLHLYIATMVFKIIMACREGDK